MSSSSFSFFSFFVFFFSLSLSANKKIPAECFPFFYLSTLLSAQDKTFLENKVQGQGKVFFFFFFLFLLFCCSLGNVPAGRGACCCRRRRILLLDWLLAAALAPAAFRPGRKKTIGRVYMCKNTKGEKIPGPKRYDTLIVLRQDPSF